MREMVPGKVSGKFPEQRLAMSSSSPGEPLVAIAMVSSRPVPGELCFSRT